MTVGRATKLIPAILLAAAVIVAGVVLLPRVWPGNPNVEHRPDRPSVRQEPERVFAGSSDRLQRTAILPTLDSPIPGGKSAIWCISLQLAWNVLKDDVAGGPV